MNLELRRDRSFKFFLSFLMLLSGSSAYADQSSNRANTGSMTVYGRKRSNKKITGTRYEIKRSESEAFNDTDPHKVISEAPGTYVQDEDGYGLRPNIGIRGTHPHRSKKITLLEDGILLGPAPYSAPAAYYFPQMTKITGADLIKGSMSSLYGPTSIGGAFNFKTREITNKKLEGGVNLIGGTVRRERAGLNTGSGSRDDKYASANIISGHVSQRIGNFSYLIEAGMADARGFKELENINNETGFDKWDGLLKAKYKINKKQSISFKASRASETSNETYLGLTLDDFSVNPYQRYAASQLDEMVWDQEQMSLTYENKFSKKTSLIVSAYEQKFRRDWNKFDRFAGSNAPSIQEVIDNPNAATNEEYYRILTGEFDTENTGVDTIVLTNNGRSYYSRGLQAALNYNLRPAKFTKLMNTTGVRYHRDGVSRNHISSFYDMFEGELFNEFSETLDDETVTRNNDRSSVITAFHQSTLRRGKWTFDGSFRLERVFQDRFDSLLGESSSKDQTIFAPGVGVSKTLNSKTVVFAGVHRGMGAAGVSPSEGARPEESINYELGYRVVDKRGKFEVAAFATDYQNIKGFCSASSGCAQEQLDEEFSGGSALIYGLEASIKTFKRLSKRVSVPFLASYTLTNAEFNNRFESGASNDWGEGIVEKGDPLPYVPQHQFSLSTGFKFGRTLMQVRWNKRSSVFDQSVNENRKKIRGYEVTDVAATYPINRKLRLTASIDNITGEDYITSFRPFGARPGKPRHYKLGLNYKF